jgi:hypothetical protein
MTLTHDRATMPDYAYQRLTGHEKMPGIFVLPDKMPVGKAIADLTLIIEMQQTRGVGRAGGLPATVAPCGQCPPYLIFASASISGATRST